VVQCVGHKAKHFVLQCINDVSSNPFKGEQNNYLLKNSILTLVGLISVFSTLDMYANFCICPQVIYL